MRTVSCMLGLFLALSMSCTTLFASPVPATTKQISGDCGATFEAFWDVVPFGDDQWKVSVYLTTDRATQVREVEFNAMIRALYNFRKEGTTKEFSSGYKRYKGPTETIGDSGERFKVELAMNAPNHVFIRGGWREQIDYSHVPNGMNGEDYALHLFEAKLKCSAKSEAVN